VVQKEIELSAILQNCRHAVQLLDTFEVSLPNKHGNVVMQQGWGQFKPGSSRSALPRPLAA